MSRAIVPIEEKSDSKPTKAKVERAYPVRSEEARDVALRRLSYRDCKFPIEFEIWQEFRQFPEVLGAYQGAATAAEQAAFEDRYRWNREQHERRIYGAPIQDELRQPDGVGRDF